MRLLTTTLLALLALLFQPAAAQDLRPESLLIYYAWPSIVFGEPGADQPGVANRFGSYDHVVLGGGLEQPTLPEYTFTRSLISDPALSQSQI